MIKWPDDLIGDIARRKSVLYLGAGVSANATGIDEKSHPKTWKEFLRWIVDEKKEELGDSYSIIEELIDEKQYLLACEVLVEKIGETMFGEYAADAFRRPGFKPTAMHDIIYSLDSRIVITPNIDKIYEQCASNNSNGTVVIKKYYEDIASYLRQMDYLVIKAHGCVDDPTKIVFTHEQYNIARYQYESFYRMIDALLLTNTFVFIGCGLNDPDIQLTLENLNFSFPHCKPHYFITEKGNVKQAVEESIHKNRNIRILTYDNADGAHAELLNDLSNLSTLVDEKRKKYAATATW